MSVQNINAKGIYAPYKGLHSLVSIAPVGKRIAFTAGICAWDEDGKMPEELKGNLVGQAISTMRNIKKLLDSLGCTLDDVLRFNTHVV
jgi:enamine deaminase RidA (YjgF/YER057c/UK114 family)